VGALTDRDTLAPGQLISYALHVLGPLDEVRRRLRLAQETEPAPQQPTSQSETTPPAARIDAARARSRLAATATSSAPVTAYRAPLPDRHNHRSPS